ncbi:hypothetical protein T02_3531 [Trichinella nativa]|uniref:Uncharacterized protein n=1 Tax=Trichinella nativa TaxID=6335 RepID=A0A0V1LU15_9BILA|nr:hypothetical protein T02_3531 [Trichinella nativa]
MGVVEKSTNWKVIRSMNAVWHGFVQFVHLKRAKIDPAYPFQETNWNRTRGLFVRGRRVENMIDDVRIRRGERSFLFVLAEVINRVERKRVTKRSFAKRRSMNRGGRGLGVFLEAAVAFVDSQFWRQQWKLQTGAHFAKIAGYVIFVDKRIKQNPVQNERQHRRQSGRVEVATHDHRPLLALSTVPIFYCGQFFHMCQKYGQLNQFHITINLIRPKVRIRHDNSTLSFGQVGTCVQGSDAQAGDQADLIRDDNSPGNGQLDTFDTDH